MCNVHQQYLSIRALRLFSGELTFKEVRLFCCVCITKAEGLREQVCAHLEKVQRAFLTFHHSTLRTSTCAIAD